MTTIRVTPLGGAPLELPECTLCIEQRSGDVRIDVAGGTVIPLSTRWLTVHRVDGSTANVHRLACILGHVADRSDPSVFVHIGDAWPLCTVETWRARAERLEAELVAMRVAIDVVTVYLEEWRYEDRGYNYNACPSCNWNTQTDRPGDSGLGHHEGCELRAALNTLERQ